MHPTDPVHPTDPAPAERSRGLRPRPVAYALLVAGAVGALSAAGSTWARETGGLGQPLARSGADVTGSLATVLAGVLGAGTLLLLTLRSTGRRVLSGALALVGAGMLALGIARTTSAGATWLPVAYAAAGLAGLLGAVVVAATAHRWPAPSGRYARRDAAAGTAPDDDPADVWRALDEGIDPTARGRSAGTRGPDRPE